MQAIQSTWKYRNTVSLLASLLVLFILADTELVHGLIRQIGEYGYLGAGIVGIFFVSTFTVAPASVVLFHLAQELHPLWIAFTAGSGGVIGDLLIFRLLKDRVLPEIRPILQDRLRRSHLTALFHSPYFGWLPSVIGALIIASPLPDEMGIALMGFSRISTWQFVLLTFVLNSVGIFIIVSLATFYN